MGNPSCFKQDRILFHDTLLYGAKVYGANRVGFAFEKSCIEPQCALTKDAFGVMTKIASWEGTLDSRLAISKPSLALRPLYCGGQ